MKSVITRERRGRSYRFFLNEQPIKDKEEIKYLKSLGIPPAWKNVSISPSRHSKIQATGYDKAGRMQYVYNAAFRAKQDKAKFERILIFAQALPLMRKVTAEHLKEPGLGKQKVLAAVVQLMDKAYFRVGNEVYAQENQSYGLTTMRSKHTKITGDTIVFDFVGKSGQDHHKEVTNKKIAKLIKKLEQLPGYEIFKYKGEDGVVRNIDSSDVNEYIKDLMGEEFSAKDFRTWGGTVLAATTLASLQRPHNERERKKAVTECVKKVAKKLGNTPAITRGSYIDPRIIKTFMDGDDLAKVRQTIERVERLAYLSKDEQCLLGMLQKA